ncbi:MAG: GntR family transcriptional regulator [Bacteroidia bacterium]
MPLIAETLQCSVTPIREAMKGLAYAGLVRAVPNRGFVLESLDETEAFYLYELIVELESTAIRKAQYQKQDFLRIKMAQAQFAAATSPEERFECDLLFHKALTDPYPNSFLHNYLHDLKIRTFFYEYQFMDQLPNTDESEVLHNQIITALEQGNKKLAIKALTKNWMNILTILKPILNNQ